LAFGLISAFGQNLAFGRTTAFGLITAFGYIMVGCCIALQLHHSPNCLAVADGLIVKINDLQRTEMFYSTNEFQLFVNSIVILNCEGARAVPITVSEGANAVPVIFHDRSSKFIVASNSGGEISKAESECFGINGQISLTELIVTMFGRSNQSLLNDDFQLVVKLIPILTSEGARAPSPKLIVGCGYSEISFHFCEDCRIFREGVKGSSTINIVSNNGIFGHISLVDLSGFNGISGLVGRISLVGLTA
jgi:hypothetical protein